MKRAYLLCGAPGTGKTTLIKEALARAGIRAGGFYTEEIRSGGIRQGFRIVTLEGESAVLAHVAITGPYRVSKYGVDVEALEKVGVASLLKSAREGDIVVVDEIGKMELFSPSFREAVKALLEGEKGLLGTIMAGLHPWAEEIKRHPAVEVIPVTRWNHAQILEKVVRWLRGEECNGHWFSSNPMP